MAGAASWQPTESFRGLLLTHRGHSGLIQRELAARAGVSHRALQDWESGVTLPTAGRLRALIGALLDSNGLTAGQELRDARELWLAVERDGSRMLAPFDNEWFHGLLAARERSNSR